MALWLPALKVALPYVASIVSSAIPVFTARKDQEKANDLISRQIGELQDAVTGNAAAVKVLAEQLANALAAAEQGAETLEQSLDESRRLLARYERMADEREQRLAGLERRLARARQAATLALVIGAAALIFAVLAWLG